MKKCTKCLNELPFDSFHKNARTKTGYACHCKRCARENVIKSRDKVHHCQVVKNRRNDLRKFVIEYLSVNPCVDCGESNPIVLDFDHVMGDKTDSVSRMVMVGFSIKKISEEINKCDVRCANCHRIVTAKRNKQHWMHKTYD